MLQLVVFAQFSFTGKYFDAEITFVDVVVSAGDRLLLVYLGMPQHVPLEGEGLVAVFTLVGSFRFVSGFMLFEVAWVLESSVAGPTLVRFVLAVGPHVTSQG